MKTFTARSSHLPPNGILALLMASFASSFAHAQTHLPLNKLDQCDDLITIQKMVDNNSISGLCRLPRSRLERAIDERAAMKMIGASYCLSDPPMVSSLRGFSCVQTEYSGSRSFSCFRSLDVDLIADFKTNYSLYREQTRAYLNAPSSCPLSNSNAVMDSILTAPMPIAEVAKVELGFRLSIGPMSSRRRTIDHHFAVVDDSLGLGESLGIEVVTFVSPSTTKATTVSNNFLRQTDSAMQTIGDLIVSISNEHNFTKDFKRVMPKQVPIEVVGVSFDFKKKPLSGDKSGVYDHLPIGTAERIGELAESEGFEKMDDHEIEIATGMKLSDFASYISERTPFGIRNSRFLSFDQHAKLYVTESHPTCDGTGAIGVVVLSVAPRQKTLEIGSVIIFVMGVGLCGNSPASARYMKRFREQATSSVIQHTVTLISNFR